MNDKVVNEDAAGDTASLVLHDAALARLVQFYETLDLASIGRVSAMYAENASFKDPFNEVSGHAAIMNIFEHMFVQVLQPQFCVICKVIQGNEAFLTWNFEFRMKRSSASLQCIRGASHIRFAGDGRVSMHRDYWDAAEELYEKLPVLGALMRMLKRSARA